MFINKYNFALKDGYNIPTYLKRYKKETNNLEEDEIPEKVKTKKIQKKEIDKNLVICNVRSKNINHEINKYLDSIKKAYDTSNYYPILIYPEYIKILNYKNSNTISIKKIMEPVKCKHGFTFDNPPPYS